MAVFQRWQALLWFRIGARRALLETLVIQTILLFLWPLFLILPLQRFPSRSIFALFLLFYIFCSIAWCALRWQLRPPSRSRMFQLLIEIEIAGIFLLEISGLFGCLTLLIKHIPAYAFINAINLERSIVVVALCSGSLFFAFRSILHIWHFWNRLRRTHLRWALTHAHLMVVVIGAGVISILLMGIFIVVSINNPASEPFAPFVILPIMVLITSVVLALVLPPSALFSYIFVRRTTQRIERLAAATGVIRGGNYGVRVSIEGEDEIARLQTDFNAMAENLERTMNELQRERDTVNVLLHARRELIANVSHELRTPVATVRSYLESTLSNWNDQPPVTLRQDLHIMEEQTIRLQSLINDLFTLARAEVKRLEMRCIPTRIELLVKRVAEMMAPVVWHSSKVEVLADIEVVQPEFPLALVDENRLEQVLQNLLHNAVRHTPPGGIIVISARVDIQVIVLQVKDTGEGIPSAELPQIWERFYRTESARAHPSSGTGLGLTIVKELTEAMGGTVSVMSVLGQGTCFTIRVPRVTPVCPGQNSAGQLPPLAEKRASMQL